jgi:hypothetical protein
MSTIRAEMTGRKLGIKELTERYDVVSRTIDRWLGNDEIVAEALTLINPPDDQREACRAKVASRISLIQEYAQGLRPRPTPRQVREQLARYLRTLQATKKASTVCRRGTEIKTSS